MKVEVYDLIADPILVKRNMRLHHKNTFKYEVAILAVAHQVFIEKGIEKYKNPNGAIIYDIKSVLDKQAIDGRF